MSAENRHRSGRYFGQLLDEARTLGAKAFDHMPVVHDLVPNIHRRAEPLERALDDVDGTDDARAKTSRLRENHAHADPFAGTTPEGRESLDACAIARLIL